MLMSRSGSASHTLKFHSLGCCRYPGWVSPFFYCPTITWNSHRDCMCYFCLAYSNRSFMEKQLASSFSCRSSDRASLLQGVCSACQASGQWSRDLGSDVAVEGLVFLNWHSGGSNPCNLRTRPTDNPQSPSTEAPQGPACTLLCATNGKRGRAFGMLAGSYRVNSALSLQKGRRSPKEAIAENGHCIATKWLRQEWRSTSRSVNHATHDVNCGSWFNPGVLVIHASILESTCSLYWPCIRRGSIASSLWAYWDMGCMKRNRAVENMVKRSS